MDLSESVEHKILGGMIHNDSYRSRYCPSALLLYFKHIRVTWDIVKLQIVRYPVGLGWSPRTCISTKFPDNVHASGSWTML